VDLQTQYGTPSDEPSKMSQTLVSWTCLRSSTLPHSLVWGLWHCRSFNMFSGAKA
jgi:hypothetical protein